MTPTREEPLDNVEHCAALIITGLLPSNIGTLPRVDVIILTSHAVILIQVTVSSVHVLKREHVVPLYANIPANIRNKTRKLCG